VLDDLLRALERRLFGRPSAPAETPALAVAVLIAAVGRVGPKRAPVDASVIAAALGRQLGVAAGPARALAAQAQAVVADEALALFPYTHACRAASDYGRRLTLIDALWRIVLARGEEPHEAAYVDEVASLLGLSREACMAERWRVLHAADGAPAPGS